MHHAVALRSGVEEGGADQLGAAISELLESHGLNRYVGRHTIPLEAGHDALHGHDFSIAALETVRAVLSVLDEAPVPTAPELEALDHQSIAAPPPLGDQFRFGHCFPNALALGIEHALQSKITVAGSTEECARRCADCGVRHSLPFVRSRNVSRWSRRSASICW